ncbi:hypothetical protein ACLOJK_016557 [Asimina triloba]
MQVNFREKTDVSTIRIGLRALRLLGVRVLLPPRRAFTLRKVTQGSLVAVNPLKGETQTHVLFPREIYFLCVRRLLHPSSDMETIPLSTTPAILLSYALLLLILHPSSAARLFNQFVYPNFTASNFDYIDNSGVFLASLNGTFQASLYNRYPALPSSYYLCILHVASNTLIWSANRDRPISASGFINLTAAGISVHRSDGTPVWSTPPLRAAVTALRLSESGNLELLDRSNGSLWSSFDHPTDTIVIGQPLRPGTELASSVSDSDPSTGSYRLQVSTQDAFLQWLGQQYWRLSMDPRAFKNSNSAVDYLQINRSGLYLFGGGGVVWQLSLQLAEFGYANLDSSGRLDVYRVSGSNLVVASTAPFDGCQLPLSCGRLGFCEDANGFCSCPAGFAPSASKNNNSCVPLGAYDFPPPGCSSSSSITYIKLQDSVGYFENRFSAPASSGIELSSCQDLCSKNCSCVGFFYTYSSSSCYLIEDVMGSVSRITDGEDKDEDGYVKVVIRPSDPNVSAAAGSGSSGRNFPLTALILLPCSGAILLVLLAMGFLWWRRSRALKSAVVKLGRPNSTSSTDDTFSIPGLPLRLKYEELEAATENFNIQIGSGGFGAVYKGTLPDKTLVAVKVLNNIGIQGKREFCTEIAVIGNIHHVNLVRLRGFCAHGQRRLLVYEYMNRGSLDRSLFRQGPVLEWQERMDIALGTARGLAYLHGGCEHKIIHCDVKPENILLHDQQVKISDFGLAKLLNPEQSNLFTTMRGTRGYLAPEWLTNSAISDKTDVYSYGMVLLELVRGRKNCSVQGQSRIAYEERSDRSSNSLSGSAYFPLLALEMHEQGRYLELADPRLEGRATSREVEKLVRIALCCVHEEPLLRPSMGNVVAMLEGAIVLIEPRIGSLNFLRFYGRRFTEPSTLDGNTQHLYRLGNTSLTSSSSGTQASLSYLSSQQVSGPRPLATRSKSNEKTSFSAAFYCFFGESVLRFRLQRAKLLVIMCEWDDIEVVRKRATSRTRLRSVQGTVHFSFFSGFLQSREYRRPDQSRCHGLRRKRYELVCLQGCVISEDYWKIGISLGCWAYAKVLRPQQPVVSVVKSNRSIWRLSTITHFFWAIVNFIGVFFATMFSMEKSDEYKKRSGASKKWDGGPGGGGPGSGPYGGGPRGPPRGLDNVRGVDHNLPALKIRMMGS